MAVENQNQIRPSGCDRARTYRKRPTHQEDPNRYVRKLHSSWLPHSIVVTLRSGGESPDPESSCQGVSQESDFAHHGDSVQGIEVKAPSGLIRPPGPTFTCYRVVLGADAPYKELVRNMGRKVRKSTEIDIRSITVRSVRLLNDSLLREWTPSIVHIY
jgi:hypothetical protein